MTDRGADLLLYGIMLILPLAALIARRPPLGQTLKMALAWVGIFAVGLLVASQWQRFGGITAMLNDQQISGTETRIRMAEDGHFWANVEIDETKRRMLIDSGATTTALSPETAAAAGLDLDESPFATVIETANGAVTARTATARRVTIGTVTATDLGVVSSPAFGDTNVIGMNFLSRLASWRVEGGTLILTPKPS
ncbi:TIGR02281 family clan AA aspartic protease [Sphingomonas ginsenosidivorax]|uniref:TIGR02281 family clan AA aspartic protease n=1 Tax=Sphingomonas ginsenosidivorax TaxID=862135 RepID=A0A5C6UER9_9SPHN|nr:TIGR02281 family clan AA aspartic protease [Sphingomonas ginsenosidivorax]TXC70535.1 TIGR02281 family clan AA aspartic protease [Sphingomonas ginsenosidivorax]